MPALRHANARFALVGLCSAALAVPAASAQTELPPLDGRLGGTVESFQTEHGAPVEAGSALFTEYEIEGYGTVFADEYEGRIESITLFSPRPEGVEWEYEVPHEMDWSIIEAHQLVEDFLPRDAQLNQPDDSDLADDSAFGIVPTEGYSPALASEVPVAVYEYVDHTFEVGQFSYVLSLNADETGVNTIFVELEVEEPLP
jgi:hypothetical protein